jgi:CRISPR-associated protein Cmr1
MDALTWEWRLKALTDLWTGDADGKAQRTIPTGLLGSIRWWFEVLVRGLGGTACDPSDADNRCPDQQGRRCVVCELFGCTGWGRKFRFEVRDVGGAVKSDQITKGTEFILRFTPLRPIAAEEWALLDLTLRLIADYGALGGKTVLKPSDEAGRRDLPHHRDYGLVKVEHRLSVEPRSQAELEGHVRDGRWRKPPQQDFAWASLANFWCVNGRYLARQSANQSNFNKALGRREPKNQGQQLAANNETNRWLAGHQQKSKKVFSFKEPPRTFGFQRPGLVSFDNIKARLRTAWPDFKDDDFVTGDVILTRLMTRAGVAP